MRSFFAMLVFFQMTSAMAAPRGEKLIDCNIANGPDQQVVVTRSGGALTLNELTNSGSWISRALSNEEWSSGVLELRGDDYGTKSTLTSDEGGWLFELRGPGVAIKAYADCE